MFPDAQWYKRNLFVCFSVEWLYRECHNGIMKLDLDNRVWKSIDLPKNLLITNNPLKINMTKGIIIFTNTHVRNPTVMYYDKGYMCYYNSTAFYNKDKSYIYRLAVG